jgi:biotin carboxylase
MINTLLNKKLLVLGANVETIPLIETAKSLGVYVYVTDFNPNAPAKKYANKAIDIDGLDIDELAKLCKSEKIDGIIVGVADRLIVPYVELCNKLGLPCYATKEQCEYFTNKHNFNELCSRYGIKTIPNYNTEFTNNNLLSIIYPVFVKPTDANSGKGMSICHNENDLRLAVEKAKIFSNSSSFLIERYMQCDDMFIYYTFKEGELFVSATADRYTTDKQGDVSRVCIEAHYPSKHNELYFNTLHQKMIQMFRDLNVKNGIFMISAFVENNEIHLYDPGFRLQGEAPNIPIEAICGFDQKAMLVNFALTGSMGEIDLNNKNDINFNNQFATTFWLLAKEGTIEVIEGIKEIEKHKCVINVSQRLNLGDIVTKEMIGTESQVFARIYLNTKSKDELISVVNFVQKAIIVLDSNRNYMLLNSDY